MGWHGWRHGRDLPDAFAIWISELLSRELAGNQSILIM